MIACVPYLEFISFLFQPFQRHEGLSHGLDTGLRHRGAQRTVEPGPATAGSCVASDI